MRRGKCWYAGLLALLLALLGACSGTGATTNQSDTATSKPGDPVVGEQLFHQTLRMTGAPTCSTCHVVEPNMTPIVGPSLTGIATTAATRLQGQSADEYMLKSIVLPNEYIVAGYNAGIMPRTYEALLTEQQINDIVAYLMTLK